MTLGDFLKLCYVDQVVSVFELGGAPVARYCLPCEVPSKYHLCEVLCVSAGINCLFITIQEV